jgi:hypothetical protein
MNEQHVIADPHGLVRSGEELAPLPELARLLGCSGKALRELLGGPLSGRVRFVRYEGGPRRYCVADARAALEPHREALEERRRRAAEIEERERAAKAAKAAATAARHEALLAAKERVRAKRAPGRGQMEPKRQPDRPAEPEVFVRKVAPR